MLSRKQVEALKELHAKEYRDFFMFPYCGKNKPSWTLVKEGLAQFDFGPRNSFLQTYVFMPLWTDPVC